MMKVGISNSTMLYMGSLEKTTHYVHNTALKCSDRRSFDQLQQIPAGVV